MKPYRKAQTIRYVGLQDRRRKITDEQRDEIKELRNKEGLSYRELARRYGVSRSLITQICDKEAARKVAEHIKATWRKYREQRGKAENARTARDFKNRKYRMYMAGELSEKPEKRTEDKNETNHKE